MDEKIIRAAAQLWVGSPRYWGQVNCHGCVVDHTFETAQLSTGYSDAPQIRSSDWDLKGTLYVPALNGVILEPQPDWTALDAEEWSEVGTAGTWDYVKPPYFDRHQFLRQCDTDPDGVHEIISDADLPSNPWIRLLYYPFEVAPGRVSTDPPRVVFSFPLGRNLQLQLQLEDPAEPNKVLIGVAYGTPPTGPKPESGDAFLFLKDDSWWGQGGSAPEEDPWFVAFHRMCLPSLVVQSGGMAGFRDLWIGCIGPSVLIASSRFRESTLIDVAGIGSEYGIGITEIPAGPVSLKSLGYSLVAAVTPLTFEEEGTIERCWPITWPSWLNDLPAITAAEGYDGKWWGWPSSKYLSVDWQYEARFHSSKPKITMTRVSENETPGLRAVQECHTQTWLAREQSLVMAGQDLVEATYEHDLLSSISRMTATLKNHADQVQQYSWDETVKPNGFIRLTCAQDIGGDMDAALAFGSALPCFTGFVRSKLPVRPEGALPQHPLVRLTAENWTYRLSKKRIMCLGGFAGWSVWAAAKRILNECGVPDDCIGCYPPGSGRARALAEAATIPLVTWDQIDYAFPNGTPVIHALDTVLAAAGWEWMVAVDGSIILRRANDYSAEPTWTLSDAVPDDDLSQVHHIGSVHGQDIGANVIYVEGRDKFGRRLDGMAVGFDSIWQPNSPLFIGDDWWEYWDDQSNPNPLTAATHRLDRERRYCMQIEWSQPGNAAMLPGHYLRVDVDYLGVPANALFRILSKRGEIRHTGKTCLWRESFVAGWLE